MNESCLRFLWRILLSVLVIVSSMIFALVNIPVVRDVAKAHLPTVIGLVLATELVALFCGAILAWRCDITRLFDKRLSWFGEFYCLAMAIFGCWATLRFPIWTRWGFIRRFIELKGWNPDPFQEPFYVIGFLLAVGCFPVLYIAIRWLYQLFAPEAAAFLRSLSFAERTYIGLFWGIGTAVLLAVSSQSSIFTYPMPTQPQPQGSDFPMGISVSDSALLINGDTFCNNTSSANDIRQPLFGLVCAPVAALAHLMTQLVWRSFLPQANYKLLYGIALAFWQIGAFALVGVLLRRLLLKIVDSAFAWSVVALYSVCFSTVLFALTVEQYAISLLALVIFVYYSIAVREEQTVSQTGESLFFDDPVFAATDHESSGASESSVVFQNRFDVLSFCAIGTLLTSVLPVFFFLWTTARNWRQTAFNYTHLFVVWVLLSFYTGKIGLLLNLGQRVENLSGYADIDSTHLGPVNKLIQFLHSIYSMILPAQMYYENGVALQVVPSGVSPCTLWTAGVLLVLAAIGFLGFFRNRFAQLAFLWVLFSFFLMGIMGWGGRENGMILYGSYFAWAFVPLWGMAIYRLTGNNARQIGVGVMACCTLIVAVCSACSIAEISFQAQDWFFAK